MDKAQLLIQEGLQVGFHYHESYPQLILINISLWTLQDALSQNSHFQTGMGVVIMLGIAKPAMLGRYLCQAESSGQKHCSNLQ